MPLYTVVCEVLGLNLTTSVEQLCVQLMSHLSWASWTELEHNRTALPKSAQSYDFRGMIKWVSKGILLGPVVSAPQWVTPLEFHRCWYNDWDIVWWRNYENMLSHFDRILECDGQTQTELLYQYCASVCWRAIKSWQKCIWEHTNTINTIMPRKAKLVLKFQFVKI